MDAEVSAATPAATQRFRRILLHRPLMAMMSAAAGGAGLSSSSSLSSSDAGPPLPHHTPPHTRVFVLPDPVVYSMRPTIQHWQLRDLICCPADATQVYYAHGSGVNMYDTALRQELPVLSDVGFKPASIACTPEYMAVGGLAGELNVYDMRRKTMLDTRSQGSINNSLLFHQYNGDVQLYVCNNDRTIKLYDVPSMAHRTTVTLPSPVNAAGISPDGRHMVAVGDCNQAFVFERNSHSFVLKCKVNFAHDDFAFSCAWNPRSTHFAVASQDGTVTVWDVRQMSSEIVRLRSKQSKPNGACRSIKYAPGSVTDLLMFTEHTNLVHLVDTRSYDSEQIVRIGERLDMSTEDIAGATFSPDGKHLFAASSSRLYDYSMDTLSRRVFPSGSLI